MFKSGNLSFSFSTIYWSNDFSSFSFLSRYLLECYMLELDNFLLSFSQPICLISNLPTNLDSRFRYCKFVFNSVPLKLEKNLSFLISLKEFNILRFKVLFNNYSDAFFNYFPTNFKRTFLSVRYIGFILIGFLCSKNYANFVFSKLSSFVRSCLLFDFKDLSTRFYFGNSFYFLGFKFSKSVKRSYCFNYNMREFFESYTGRLKFRISSFRKKILKCSVDRINSELFLHFLSVLQHKKLSVSLFSLRNKKFWSFIFQLECIRSLQYGKLLFSEDKVDILSYSLFSKIKFFDTKKIIFCRKYSFNLYFRKLHFILKEVINSTNNFFNNSILPIDLTLQEYVTVLNKKVSFVYENLYYSKSFISSQNQFSVSDKSSLMNVYSCWKVSIPKQFIFRKLRAWGFIHPFKNRPISNSKFLFLDDLDIVKNFNNIFANFLFWLCCCDDFSSLKFFIEVIRQSCFLTICRKHNKSKSWVYSVFTPNLLLNKSFCSFTVAFFYNKISPKVVKKKFLLQNFIFFDEKFFLANF